MVRYGFVPLTVSVPIVTCLFALIPRIVVALFIFVNFNGAYVPVSL